MTKTLTIRADCSPTMGTGHVMRMIALGQAWQALGGTVSFVGLTALLADRLENEGFSLVHIDSIHPDPADAQTLLTETSDTDWVAIDGYHFDTAYQKTIHDAGRRTLVLDDLHDRGEYCADILLNQNPDGPQYPYILPEATMLLLGTKYTLLRKDFQRSDTTPTCPDTARKVLVTMGGADPTNATARAIAAISESEVTDLHVKVVVGAANPHLDELRGIIDSLPFNCELLTAVKDMPALMRWSDLAVSAAGTTSWELCFFGVPFIAIEIADNQKGIIRELKRHEAAVCLDSTASLRDIATEFERLTFDNRTRQRMRNAGRQLVDGKGAMRVAKAMYNADISLRHAEREDCEMLLKWRNAPETRANSFNSDVISLDTHRPWFEKKLGDEDCLFLIATDGETPVGQIRFDRQGTEAIVSVSVSPNMMNRGIGSLMTRLGCAAMHKDWPGITAVALVKRDNPASATMFTNAGFTQDKSDSDHLRFTWTGQ